MHEWITMQHLDHPCYHTVQAQIHFDSEDMNPQEAFSRWQCFHLQQSAHSTTIWPLFGDPPTPYLAWATEQEDQKWQGSRRDGVTCQLRWSMLHLHGNNSSFRVSDNRYIKHADNDHQTQKTHYMQWKESNTVNNEPNQTRRQEKEACVSQAWQQMQVFLAPRQTVFVIYVNLLEQKRASTCLQQVGSHQNWQPAAGTNVIVSDTQEHYYRLLRNRARTSYPTSHIKGSPQNSTSNWNVLFKLLDILLCPIRKHSSTTREDKIRPFFFHPSLVPFPVSYFIVGHILMPYLGRKERIIVTMIAIIKHSKRQKKWKMQSSMNRVQVIKNCHQRGPQLQM